MERGGRAGSLSFTTLVVAIGLSTSAAGGPVSCSAGRTLAIDKGERGVGIDPHPRDGSGFKYNHRAYACLRANGNVRRLGVWDSGGDGFDEIGPYHFAVG